MMRAVGTAVVIRRKGEIFFNRARSVSAEGLKLLFTNTRTLLLLLYLYRLVHHIV